jgi:hypothetical protein
MRRETHVRFYESLGVKLPGLLTQDLGIFGACPAMIQRHRLAGRQVFANCFSVD